MGADGGIIILQIKDKDNFLKLTDWILGRIVNEECLGFRNHKEDLKKYNDLQFYLIEGGYGTDLFFQHTLEDLICFCNIESYLDNILVENYTWKEIKEAWETRPLNWIFDIYYIDTNEKFLRFLINLNKDKEIENMLLKDWKLSVRKNIISTSKIQTWT